MILFHAKRDGTVTTTPDLVPQGSSMQDLVVVSEFAYAYCAIRLLPASGEYIEDIPCTPILQSDLSTIFTAALPPKATVVAGSVDYQLVFTAADGTTQTTLVGSFTVPRGVPVSTPPTVGELSSKTVGDLYAIIGNVYALFAGHEANIYQSIEDIAALKKTIASSGYVTIPVSEWTDGMPTIATFDLDGFGAGMTAMLIPADSNTQTAAREARLSAYPVAFPIDSDTQTVEIIRANAEKAPEIPLRFAYLILKTEATIAPSVAIIGVDAYGEGGGTGGGVDSAAVEEIVTRLVPGWARQENPPPYPVTSVNSKTGEVSLTAGDVGADPDGSAEAVAARVAEDLRSYYTKTEVNGLVSAIPKFSIEAVDSLPTSGMSSTTVYLVKDKTSSGDLYTEYIYVGGAWEELGRQTVNLSGYVTSAKLTEILSDYATKTSLSTAINTALAQAKASGEFDGKDGKSAYAYAKDGGYTGTEAEFAALLANATDKRKLSLGIASDGLIYVYVDGTPVGTGIPQGQSGDVFGYVDANNRIVIKGDLADGNYTVAYEMDDGTTVDIGDLVLGLTYTDLVPTAKGSDGAVLNGVGYQRDARWSTSAGTLTTSATGYTAVGFTAMTGGQALTIYVYGLELDGSTNSALITTKALTGTTVNYGYKLTGGFTGTTFVASVEKLANYYYKITTLASGSTAKYFALSGKTVSSMTPAVTLGEPIIAV